MIGRIVAGYRLSFTPRHAYHALPTVRQAATITFLRSIRNGNRHIRHNPDIQRGRQFG